MTIGLVGNRHSIFLSRLERELLAQDVKIVWLSLDPRRQGVSVGLARLVTRCDVVYGMYKGFAYRLWFLPRMLGKTTVNHWIGTDVWDLSKRGYANRAKVSAYFIDTQLADAPWFQEELMHVGIRASVLPTLACEELMRLGAMPKRHAVLAYLPEGRGEFYGSSLVMELARTFPALHFVVVGNEGSDLPPLENIFAMGVVPPKHMQNIYDRVSVLVRVPKHDGMSKMVLEALAQGKQVIFRYDLPHCLKADGYREAKEHLRRILEEAPRPDLSGHEWAVENFNPRRLVKRLLAVFSQSIEYAGKG